MHLCGFGNRRPALCEEDREPFGRKRMGTPCSNGMLSTSQKWECLATRGSGRTPVLVVLWGSKHFGLERSSLLEHHLEFPKAAGLNSYPADTTCHMTPFRLRSFPSSLPPPTLLKQPKLPPALPWKRARWERGTGAATQRGPNSEA